jgi:fluoroacetyl-CoA thioesterase
MKNSLKPGLTYKFQYTVPDDKTVPYLYPEAPEFQKMPRVLATGFMVGLFEWTCIQAIKPHIDWPREQSVGIGVNLNHLAATPPGLTVSVSVELKEVDGRKLVFSIIADDGIDKISEGTHKRFIIEAAKFNRKIAEKGKQRAAP